LLIVGGVVELSFRFLCVLFVVLYYYGSAFVCWRDTDSSVFH
jgi:hypothetical protein